MLPRLGFLVRYLLCWLVVFTLARVLFFVYEHGQSAHLGVALTAAVFLHGARMDLSAAAYLAVVPGMLIALSAVAPRAAIGLIRPYTVALVVLVALLTVVDLGLFAAWGIRLDAAPLLFLRTPREAFASAESSPLALLLAIGVAFGAVALWLFRRLAAPARLAGAGAGAGTASLALGLTALLLVPIRGGLQWTPLNESSVYFSTSDFANQAALNVGWNFFHSLTTAGAMTRTNPYTEISVADARRAVDSLTAASDSSAVRLLRVRRPNVILIIWESFTAKAVARLGGLPGVTPHFDSLTHEGVLFDHLYASGNRSAKGLVALLSGFPAQGDVQIMNTPEKAAHLPMLARDLHAAGYTTRFYYGGELAFANIKAYLLNGGFDQLIGESAFAVRDRNSKWGAHDHVVLARLLRDVGPEHRPFFDVLFTLSSHEPFEVPMAPVFPGTDIQSKFLNSLAYTDRSVAGFIRAASRQPWWDSTLVVIVADHGHLLPRLGAGRESVAADFHIPMLWLGGALAARDTVVSRTGSQTDLAPTLLAQLGLPHAGYVWGRNLLARDALDYAYFSYHDGFGFVDPHGSVVYDAIGRHVTERTGDAGAPEIRGGMAYLRRSFQAYIDR